MYFINEDLYGYYFITNNNLKYRILLFPSFLIPSAKKQLKEYELLIYCNDALRIPYSINDALISITITNFIKQFFNENNDAILKYECYNGDGKGDARNRLFYKWYLNYFNTSEFEIITLYIKKLNKTFNICLSTKNNDYNFIQKVLEGL